MSASLPTSATDTVDPAAESEETAEAATEDSGAEGAEAEGDTQTEDRVTGDKTCAVLQAS